MYRKIIVKRGSTWFRSVPFPFYKPFFGVNNQVLYTLSPADQNSHVTVKEDILTFTKNTPIDAIKKDFSGVYWEFKNSKEYEVFVKTNNIPQQSFYYNQELFRVSLYWNFIPYGAIIYQTDDNSFISIYNCKQGERAQILILESNDPFLSKNESMSISELNEEVLKMETYLTVFKKYISNNVKPVKVWVFSEPKSYLNFLNNDIKKFTGLGI